MNKKNAWQFAILISTAILGLLIFSWLVTVGVVHAYRSDVLTMGPYESHLIELKTSWFWFDCIHFTVSNGTVLALFNEPPPLDVSQAIRFNEVMNTTEDIWQGWSFYVNNGSFINVQWEFDNEVSFYFMDSEQFNEFSEDEGDSEYPVISGTTNGTYELRNQPSDTYSFIWQKENAAGEAVYTGNTILYNIASNSVFSTNVSSSYCLPSDSSKTKLYMVINSAQPELCYDETCWDVNYQAEYISSYRWEYVLPLSLLVLAIPICCIVLSFVAYVIVLRKKHQYENF